MSHETQARALRSLLQLSASPVAIGFHPVRPDEPPPFDGAMPAPAPDGRTGRVPAGCVFWMHATERAFATVAADERLTATAEANRAVARYAGADATRFAVGRVGP